MFESILAIRFTAMENPAGFSRPAFYVRLR